MTGLSRSGVIPTTQAVAITRSREARECERDDDGEERVDELQRREAVEVIQRLGDAEHDNAGKRRKHAV